MYLIFNILIHQETGSPKNESNAKSIITISNNNPDQIIGI